MHNQQYMMIMLDCLVDTRVATVARISPQGAVDLIRNNYHKRITDKLSTFSSHINDDEFKAAYAKRDVDTLMLAQPTRFAFELYDIVEQIYQARLDNPQRLGEIKLFINVWPYKLEVWEQEEIVGAILARLPDVYPIHIINIPLRELTTSYIQYKDFAGLFIYDLNEWTQEAIYPQLIAEGVDSVVPIPNVGIFPCMLTPDVSNMKQVIQNNKNAQGDEANPFEMVAFGLSGIIGVEYQGSELYSIARFNQ